MSPITHGLIGWSLAGASGCSRKQRAAVTFAGVIPDFDGLGIVIDTLTLNSAYPTTWWSDYHHILGHNIGFAIFIGAAAACLFKDNRTKLILLVLISFHLHLLGDIIGARGPEGAQWPIPYLLPFSTSMNLTWGGQWQLNAWPNFLITGSLLTYTFYYAWKKGYSPLEFISRKGNDAFVASLRNRFGKPKNSRMQS